MIVVFYTGRHDIRFWPMTLSITACVLRSAVFVPENAEILELYQGPHFPYLHNLLCDPCDSSLYTAAWHYPSGRVLPVGGAHGRSDIPMSLKDPFSNWIPLF